MTRPVELLAQAAHRPWPLPRSPWVMTQRWHDLLFAHWRVPAQALRALIPPALELDLFEGEAWVGVVPFRMSAVRLRACPPFPGTSAFLELNVRTYVRHADRPGVWFFSLDAESALAVCTARRWFHLPYFHARMRSDERDGRIRYRSERTHDGAGSAELALEYGALDEADFRAEPGTIEHFLTERYRLYAADRTGRIRAGEIHHPPWRLRRATATIATNTMADASGIQLENRAPELLHFALLQEVLIWPPRAVG